MNGGCTACPRCSAPIRASDAVAAESIRCPRCAIPLHVTLFPALFRDQEEGRAGERVVDESQAGCFFHQGRKATVACDMCGRFLCELCDLPMGEGHICPRCLENPVPSPVGDREVTLGTSATLYDNIALSVAVLPMLIFYMTVITAPVTLLLVIRYWNRLETPIRRSRGRFVAAGILATLQIAGWIVGIAALIYAL